MNPESGINRTGSHTTGNSRRKFLVQASTILAGSLAYPNVGDAREKRIKLTILHTNDTHSQIDPFELNDPKYPGMGGITRRAAIVEKIRAEEKNVLLLDSGDIYQGTPYFNLYGGSIEFKLMSMLGYDAATMGNHDFDIGLDGFLRNLPHARFPFLCSNYDFNKTILEGKTVPFKIFEKQGVRIGVFGVGVQIKGLVLERLYRETQYLDPIEIANDMGRKLKYEHSCDYVICLSHLGYHYETRVCDTQLAAKTKNVDLILGGHSHTFLDQPVPYKNPEGKDVLIAQTGFAGLILGRIDVWFENGSRKSRLEKTQQINVL